jgi:hypothetical protein
MSDFHVGDTPLAAGDLRVGFEEVTTVRFRRGTGTPNDPFRNVTSYWLKRKRGLAVNAADWLGELLVERDPFLDGTRECQGCQGTGKLDFNVDGTAAVPKRECGHCSGSGRMSK